MISAQPRLEGDLASEPRRLVRLAGLLALLALPVVAENTNSVYRPLLARPGGLDPHPFITSLTVTQGMATVRWSGLQAPFQLQLADQLAPGAWHNAGLATFDQAAAIPATAASAFLRIQGDEPVYVGARLCRLCHPDTHADWQGTIHAGALKTLQDHGQENNGACLVCHTVGFGYTNGFRNAVATPGLADVQCENCHGPAVRHVENVDDVTLRPAVTPAAEVCGGCHNAFHHATFDEWQTSLHSEVTPDVASSLISDGEARMLSCGPCHSGAVRLALLKQIEAPAAPLPSREDAAAYGVTCAVCHDPHEAGANPKQLRNPLYSTNFFSYSTSTNTPFAAQYNPAVQVCGQCHNQRGARWNDTSRPPHHSPQYNLLIGQGGYDLGTSSIATHGLRTRQQCAHCHSRQIPIAPDPLTNPNYTGHSFEVRFEACAATNQAAACHPSPANAEGFLELTQEGIRQRTVELKALLDLWATTKAPEALRTTYGALAWEYNNAGELSNPTSDPGVKGPTTTEQTDVPPAIKQARFNLYLVAHDASGGAHNGTYARYLLGVGKTNVLNQLGTPWPCVPPLFEAKANPWPGWRAPRHRPR